MDRPDILLFLSDQHNGRYTGYAGHPIVRTPQLDAMAGEGMVFESVYTACPLSVPARSALLSGQLPSRTGGFSNDYILPSGQATFLHALADAGYETVLCGRMHFVGPDQRHGFTRRIHGDIVGLYAGGVTNDPIFKRTYGVSHCLDVCGGGDSPVLSYDRSVIEAASGFLSESHDKPQCLVVGTYGPHFPYVAPRDQFEYYQKRVDVPASWNPYVPDPNPFVASRQRRTRRSILSGEEEAVTDDIMRAARAAYFGMITEQDRLLGLVREAWRAYLNERDRKGVLVYASDHGDTCGEHNVFGKQTLLEGAVRVPLCMEGDGIPKGARHAAPVSLLDLGPTLCDMAGATAPLGQDGISLFPSIRSQQDDSERAVYSEWMDRMNSPSPVPARMVRKGPWKLIRYVQENELDALFNVMEDPEELCDVKGAHPDVYQELTRALELDWSPERARALCMERNSHQALIKKFYVRNPPVEPPEERWVAPAECLRAPEISI